MYGCATGEKQSSVVTWLQDAQKNGAEFIKNCTIEKIMFDRGKAIGVCGTINENGMKRQVFIKADKVVVSAGSINSPALLLKSGLQNPHIGNNLKLHPVSFVTATFNSKINQHSGSIMTAISKSVSDLGNGYGAIVEVF